MKEKWCKNMNIFKGETPETLMNVISVPYSTTHVIPPLLTIFSAPNYCDRYENKGAVLLIDKELDGFRVIQYDCVEHPAGIIEINQTEHSIVAIVAACPYMPSSFKMFMKYAVELIPEESSFFDADSNDNDDDSSKVANTDVELSITPNRNNTLTQSGKKSMTITIPLNTKGDEVKSYSPGLDSTLSTPKPVKEANNKMRLSGFEHALASDAINELHPELSPMGIKDVIMMTKSVEAASVCTDEHTAISVKELRKRFENGYLGSASTDSTSSNSNLGSSSSETITLSPRSTDRVISSSRFEEIRNQFEKTGNFFLLSFY
jgi:hypothetical protein